MDYPRTEFPQWGTYEHELRFFRQDVNWSRWCDPGEGIANVFLDLPAYSYRDDVDVDDDEFTWGLPTWRLVEDYIYGIHFECSGRQGLPSNNEYNVTGQVGHCHATNQCSSISVFPDETVRLIPRIRGRAPEFESFNTTFSSNISFEPGLSPWQWLSGTAEQVCPSSPQSPKPYHATCYAILRPSSSSSTAVLYYTHIPSPSGAATGSTFNDLVVRCQSSRNADNCTARVQIVGKASDGTVTQSFSKLWSVPRSDTSWHTVGLQGNKLPSNTVSWSFRLVAGAGDALDVDYNSQHWDQVS